MRVFDISFWQSDNIIDYLVKLNANGIILRLGLTYNGVPELDEKFTLFLDKARQEDLPVGIYYYSKMNTYELAKVEAQFINDKVYEFWGGYDEPALGVWWDMEDETTKVSDIHEITMYAVDTLLNWEFKKVGIYASYSYFHDYLDIKDIATRQIPVWVAQYSRHNDLKRENPELNHYGWQFTETYDGNTLDGNEWYKL